MRWLCPVTPRSIFNCSTIRSNAIRSTVNFITSHLRSRGSPPKPIALQDDIALKTTAEATKLKLKALQIQMKIAFQTRAKSYNTRKDHAERARESSLRRNR